MFTVTLVGDRELISKLDEMPSTLRSALVKKVTSLGLQLENKVKAGKLSGTVLNVRTGNLRRSINSRVDDSGNGVYGVVFSSGDVKYAAIHEYGFHGPETVKAHMRDTIFGRKTAAFAVGAYSRQMNMPERSFLRSSLKDMETVIVDGLKEAILGALQKGRA